MAKPEPHDGTRMPYSPDSNFFQTEPPASRRRTAGQTERSRNAMPDFTPTQGRYLSFIHAYIKRRGHPPAESEIAAAMCVSPPSVNQMVKTLEKKGLILRQPGVPRSIRLLVPDDEIPPLHGRGQSKRSGSDRKKRKSTPDSPPTNLYVLAVYLISGPVGDKFAGKTFSRVIEIRGDQTLEQLHEAIFQAYDRWESHPFEFQLGSRPFDPDGPTYGITEGTGARKKGDARTTTLDELELEQHRMFGYWFDFGDDWYHQIQVERIEQATPTVTYPRVIRRAGKSPPQHPNVE